MITDLGGRTGFNDLAISRNEKKEYICNTITYYDLLPTGKIKEKIKFVRKDNEMFKFVETKEQILAKEALKFVKLDKTRLKPLLDLSDEQKLELLKQWRSEKN